MNAVARWKFKNRPRKTARVSGKLMIREYHRPVEYYHSVKAGETPPP